MFIIIKKRFILNSLKRYLIRNLYDSAFSLLYLSCHNTGGNCKDCFLREKTHCDVSQAKKAKKFLSENGYKIIERKIPTVIESGDYKYILDKVDERLHNMFSTSYELREIENKKIKIEIKKTLDPYGLLQSKEEFVDISYPFGNRQRFTMRTFGKFKNCFEKIETPRQEEFEI